MIYTWRSQWPRRLRHELSSPARTLGSWVRIPLNTWMFVCLFYVCVGSGLATGWFPIQGVLASVLGLRNWIERKRFTDALCSKVGATGKRERDNGASEGYNLGILLVRLRKTTKSWLRGFGLQPRLALDTARIEVFVHYLAELGQMNRKS
jgi:hypothetical protein